MYPQIFIFIRTLDCSSFTKKKKKKLLPAFSVLFAHDFNWIGISKNYCTRLKIEFYVGADMIRGCRVWDAFCPVWTERREFLHKVLLQLAFSSIQMPLSVLWDHKFRRLVNRENWSIANVTNIMLALCRLALFGSTYLCGLQGEKWCLLLATLALVETGVSVTKRNCKNNTKE